MKTIVVAAHKGGVGKTMLAAHIAWHFAEQGKRVLALDLDMQANLSATLADRGLAFTAGALFDDTALPALPPIAAGGLCLVASDKGLSQRVKGGMTIVPPFTRHMAQLGECFDLAVIDTNAETNYLNIAALCVATHVITPSDMSSFSRQGAHAVLQLVEKVRATQNPGLDFLGIVANRYAAGKATDMQNMRILVDTFGASVVFPAVLRDGNAYKEAMEPKRGEDDSGARPIWRDRKPAAQSHIEDMSKLMTRLDARLFGEKAEAAA